MRTEHESGFRPGNRLSVESSPYLLQHAGNPVNWYAWGDEAFDRARSENKPIFLSIGYSTCHWCHVMEQESFESQDVADILNELFVAIKVDREERPDIDAHYMTACQLITGRGGWPLTIIMTPERRPFFAATYIPRESRSGMMGLLELLPRIGELWQHNRDLISQSTEQIMAALHSSVPSPGGREGDELTTATLERAVHFFKNNYDKRYGGFGEAPKFPSPHQLIFLLRMWARSRDEHLIHAVRKTLEAMRQGGIFDHLGYGFHRYATDQYWLVPHFEKMLYDQALLSLAYSECYQATRDEYYARVVQEIMTYILRDMTDRTGGFYSAEDADSEGIEGKFYTWSFAELEQYLTEEEFALTREIYSLEPEGNFRDERTGQKSGLNIFHEALPRTELADRLGLSETSLENRLEQIRQKLFTIRQRRVHPFKDDKVLTDWNGMMIAALSRAAQVFENDLYLAAAVKATHFVETALTDSRGRLWHRFRQGSASISGFLDDYAYYVWGLLELYEASFELSYLERACTLAGIMIELFEDKQQGGFNLVSTEAEQMLTRSKELYDGAIPSGNAVAFSDCVRLAHMTGQPEFKRVATTMIRVFTKTINRIPNAYTHYLTAAEAALNPSHEIVVLGHRDDRQTRDMIKAIRQCYLPNKTVLLIDPAEERVRLDTVAPYTRSYQASDHPVTVYICSNQTCQLPLTRIEDVLEQLKKLNPHFNQRD
ncbi:thioredoxin domain-containing protein [bacterium]|nr:thioredoxin domain-containing protein [bacterium]